LEFCGDCDYDDDDDDDDDNNVSYSRGGLRCSGGWARYT
jgi:hypothetical protein